MLSLQIGVGPGGAIINQDPATINPAGYSFFHMIGSGAAGVTIGPGITINTTPQNPRNGYGLVVQQGAMAYLQGVSINGFSIGILCQFQSSVINQGSLTITNVVIGGHAAHNGFIQMSGAYLQGIGPSALSTFGVYPVYQSTIICAACTFVNWHYAVVCPGVNSPVQVSGSSFGSGIAAVYYPTCPGWVQ